jgi:hypothetical protein
VSEKLSRPKRLQCCVCGESTIGRQWWNRDTGFGICSGCAESEAARVPAEEMTDCYGMAGVHYNVNGENDAA